MEDDRPAPRWEEDPDAPRWYTARCLFRIPDEDPESDEFWYEERLTLWQAQSHAEASALAKAEATRGPP